MEGVIPDKSRSLRKTSVKKRLETEGKRKQPKSKDKRSKKARLSKYRRKSANAKERERMKKQNDVFEVLKGMVPCDKLGKTIDEDKETKVRKSNIKGSQHLCLYPIFQVTTLRAAIVYINSLKSLLADCEAGRLDSEVLRDCALTSPAGAEVKARRKSPTKRKVSSKKCDKVQPKWINYSKQDLRTKFDPKGVSDAQSPTTPPPSYTLPISSPQPYTLPTQNIPPPPSIPDTYNLLLVPHRLNNLPLPGAHYFHRHANTRNDHVYAVPKLRLRHNHLRSHLHGCRCCSKPELWDDSSYALFSQRCQRNQPSHQPP